MPALCAHGDGKLCYDRTSHVFYNHINDGILDQLPNPMVFGGSRSFFGKGAQFWPFDVEYIYSGFRWNVDGSTSKKENGIIQSRNVCDLPHE